MKQTLLFTITTALLFLVGCHHSSLSSYTKHEFSARYFQHLEPTPPFCESCPPRMVKMIETDQRGEPLTGDTLRVWMEHRGPGDKSVGVGADEADLIISCYPETLARKYRERHVLPRDTGEVWITHLRGRYLIVTDRLLEPIRLILESID